MRNILEIKRERSEREKIYRDLSFPSVLKTQFSSMFGLAGWGWCYPGTAPLLLKALCSRVEMELTWGGLHRALSLMWSFSGSVISLTGKTRNDLTGMSGDSTSCAPKSSDPSVPEMAEPQRGGLVRP